MADAKKLLKNIASLGLMQVVNYVLPILIMPFLVVKIGISNVGLLATFTAIAAYMQIVIDYGFNLSATRDIAKDGYTNERASVVTSSVLTIKLFFSLLFIILSLLALELIPEWRVYTLPFMITVGIAVFQSMFPVWHFQAAEKMHFITACNSIPKLVSAGMVFIFVATPNDAWKVQACFMAGAVVSFIVSMIVLYVKFDFKIDVSVSQCRRQLQDGFSIFVARAASGLYKNFNVLILGLFAGTAAVGAYSIAERILRSAQMVQNVVGDTLYPSFARGFTGDKGFFRRSAERYRWHIISFYAVASVSIFLLSGLIGELIGRTSAEEVSSCLRIMSAAFFFGGLNYVCAILGLTSCGYARQFSLCVLATGVFNVICATTLSYFYSYYGASVSLALSELFLLCFVVFYSKRTGIL
ncbi:RfbX protein [Enterobacter hormaechei subsp. steigerwaltii]|uniref:oligosaccharide flippase family protein n=1 Tax=Enterobacter hormaechei TaxID=158836 RepID=UPI0005EECBAA|nr:oligosaccharide flippase family protein [Enterobacter hormaechei]KJN47969.1 RfbX protein [Enterobacter hormaechei subsp. steigerwaltii]MBJ6482895.1 oligosaccharide flippase family protein [Enterobacter hormaechei]SAA80279.1 O-antigen transporter [Enterobacter hormaechei]SAA91335.1 O-antigen transporter [Enterobacter hormaechei]